MTLTEATAKEPDSDPVKSFVARLINNERTLPWYFSLDPKFEPVRDRLAYQLAIRWNYDVEKPEDAQEIVQLYRNAVAAIEKLCPDLPPLDDIERVTMGAFMLAQGCPRNESERYDNKEAYRILRKRFRISHNSSLAKVAEVCESIVKQGRIDRYGAMMVIWSHFTRND